MGYVQSSFGCVITAILGVSITVQAVVQRVQKDWEGRMRGGGWGEGGMERGDRGRSMMDH